MVVFLATPKKVISKNVQTTVQLHSFHMLAKVKIKMKFAQLYLTLCNPMDYIAHGILQARIME